MFEKILIVDDEKDYREILKTQLNDYVIAEASTAKTAMDILGKPNDIDLVLLDVELPDAKGTEMLAAIRDNNPGIGIVILTGHGSTDIILDSLRGHADDYVNKNEGSEKIRKSVEETIRARAMENGPSRDISHEKIQKIKHFIYKNCLKNITLEDAAKVVCLSPKYLSRVFRVAVGKGFNEYKLELRIDHAENLLIKTSYTVYQVADKVGYENPESFIRQFRKKNGCTPTEYRERTQKLPGKNNHNKNDRKK